MSDVITIETLALIELADTSDLVETLIQIGMVKANVLHVSPDARDNLEIVRSHVTHEINRRIPRN